MTDIKNLGQLLRHLATKAGIQATDPNLVNILSNADLTKITLHSDLIKALDENLLSVDAAVDNHPVIGPKYKAQALNTFDKKMESFIEELDLDETAKAEVKGIRSSFERFEKLTDKIKELSAKKSAAAGTGDKVALQKQIDDLLKKMQDEQKTYTEALKKVQDERLADKISFEKRSMYGGLKTIYDTLDADIRTTSIDAIINKALQDKDAEFAYDDKGSFIVRKKDGTNLLGANHTKYTPQTLVDEILAHQKILAVNNTQHQTNHQQTSSQQRQVEAENGQIINGTNQSVANLNLEAMKTFSETQPG